MGQGPIENDGYGIVQAGPFSAYRLRDTCLMPSLSMCQEFQLISH